MPFVTVDHVANLSDADRRRLQVRMAEVVMEAFAAPPSNVRVYTRAFNPADVYLADGSTDGGLPVIRLEFLPGRSLDQKRAVVRGLAHVAAEVLQVPVGQIRIILNEKDTCDWARGDRLVVDSL
jgi:phenylpyruvate tautomerase PptA (4-oxalocrotonate tautomerase family)